MSRHLWNASRVQTEDSSHHHAEPHLGIFTATIRAVKHLAGRSAPQPQPRPGPARPNPDRPDPAELDLPVPRPAPEGRVQPAPDEETTQELPRYDMEPTEPALSMLSRGRHGMM